MKKKNMVKLMGVLLLATITCNALPLRASEALVNNATSQLEHVEKSVSNNDIDMEADAKGYFEGTMGKPDLYAINPLDLSKEEFNEYLDQNTDYTVAAWLSSLDHSTIEELMQRESGLNRSVEIFGAPICSSCGIENRHYDTALAYYQAIGECRHVKADYFNTTAGSCYFDWYLGATRLGGTTFNVSGLKTNVDVHTRQSGLTYKYMNDKMTLNGVTLAITNVDSTNATWAIAKEMADYKDKCTKADENWLCRTEASVHSNFYKPIGYSVAITETDVSPSKGWSSLRAAKDVEHYKGIRYSPYQFTGDTDVSQTKKEDFYTAVSFNSMGISFLSRVAKNMRFGITFTPTNYTVSYDANGGSGAPSAQVCTYGQTYTYQNAPSGKPSYTISFQTNGGSGSYSPLTVYRSFVNWGDVNAGASFGNLATSGTITKKANWSSSATGTLPSNPARAYTVTYNGNGGTAAATSAVANGTFQGWYSEDGKTNYGKAGTNVNFSKSMTLKAMYSNGTITLPNASKNYTVTYNSNGGSATETSKSASAAFQGWYTSASGGTKIGTNGNSYTPAANSTLYAQYGNASVILPNAAKTYTVTYNGNGGTSAQSSSTANATFNGWFTAASGGSKVGGSGGSYSFGNNVTLYAQYTNGFVTLPDATREGYRFRKWATTQTAVEGAFPSGQSYAPTANTSLYATWEANTYKVQLDANEGSIPEGIEDTIEATYDKAFSLPKPIKVGYTFQGWKGEYATYPAEENLTNLTSQHDAKVTLVAEWKANSDTKYTIVREYETGEKSGVFEQKDMEEVKGLEEAYAVADSWITVPATTVAGYDTPDAQLVRIAADGSTIVKFQYRITAKAPGNTHVENHEHITIVESNPDNVLDEDLQKQLVAMQKTLENIKNISDLSKEEMSKLQTIMAQIMGIDNSQTEKLLSAIKNSKYLSSEEQLDLIKALLSGSITEEQRKQLEKAIAETSLSEADKKQLLESIQNMTDSYKLSAEEQKRILEALEKGSSAEYVYKETVYSLKKNPDGTLTIALKGKGNEKEITIPDAITLAGKTIAVTEIAKEAFRDNQVLEKLTMGPNISKIGTSAFENCSNLKRVNIGVNVKTIGARAFYGCKELSELDIPKSVLKIGASAFENCTLLQKITFHEGLLQLGKKCFYNCISLKKIALPKSLLKINDYAFGKCAKLKTVTFADGANLTTFGSGVFSNCKSLAKIKLPQKLTSIPKKTFYKNAKLASVSGGGAVTKIGESAFQNCKKLKSFTITSKVQTLGKKAFYGCTNLQKVQVKSKALTGVGEKAFQKCKKKNGKSAMQFVVTKTKKKAYAKLLKKGL